MDPNALQAAGAALLPHLRQFFSWKIIDEQAPSHAVAMENKLAQKWASVVVETYNQNLVGGSDLMKECEKLLKDVKWHFDHSEASLAIPTEWDNSRIHMSNRVHLFLRKLEDE